MASIKKNFFYNMILTTGNYIFPLLTYPYVSRVLGVNNIGICNYVDSIINYFVMFALLGIGSFGLREIAAVKEDETQKNQVFSSLIFINIFLTIISVIILVILTLYLPLFAQYRPFLWLGIFKLIFSAFLIEWFYKGISNFKYITMRSLAVKTSFLILVFLLVRTKDDAQIYYFLVCFTVILNSIINGLYARKFVKFSFQLIRIKMYIAPVISYGFYLILTSMYTTFNVFFLGSVAGDIEVGYFATATKIYSAIMSIFSAFTAVMVPQISSLLSKGDENKIKILAGKTFSLVFLFSIPIIIISFFYAPIIIHIISGKGYEGAITPFRIVMSLLLVIALEQIIIQQFLLATRKSKCILELSALGATVGISLNLLLTTRFASIGSAISWACSEIAVLCLGLIFFHKFFKIKFPIGDLLMAYLLALPYILICIIFAKPTLNFSSIIGLLLSIIWFFVSNLFIRKNQVLAESIELVRNRFKK